MEKYSRDSTSSKSSLRRVRIDKKASVAKGARKENQYERVLKRAARTLSMDVELNLWGLMKLRRLWKRKASEDWIDTLAVNSGTA